MSDGVRRASDSNPPIEPVEAGQVIGGETFNALHRAIRLLERRCGMAETEFAAVGPGTVITASYLNRIADAIQALRARCERTTAWRHFPVQEGSVITAECFNELVDNLNEIMEPSSLR